MQLWGKGKEYMLSSFRVWFSIIVGCMKLELSNMYDVLYGCGNNGCASHSN